MLTHQSDYPCERIIGDYLAYLDDRRSAMQSILNFAETYSNRKVVGIEVESYVILRDKYGDDEQYYLTGAGSTFYGAVAQSIYDFILGAGRRELDLVERELIQIRHFADEVMEEGGINAAD